MIVNQFPDRTITVNGEKHLYFGGTSYLGMATHTAFQQILTRNLLKWGSFYGSSRNSNIKLDIYPKFEDYFTNLTLTEDSLVVASGTLAGRLVIDCLLNEFDAFFHYPKTHPAILAQNSQPLFKNGILHPNIKNGIEKKIIITVDAILSGEVTPTNFSFLDEIPKNTQVTLVIDESHTLGLLGENVGGISSTINHSIITRKIMVSSLGKALGLAGGIISSDKKFIQKIQKMTAFVSSSSANPAYLAAFLEARHIYKQQQTKLTDNLLFIDKHLKKHSTYNFNKLYPVIYTQNNTVFTELLANKIIITSFKYPTYKNNMNRIVITANHTKEDLLQLLNVLNKF